MFSAMFNPLFGPLFKPLFSSLFDPSGEAGPVIPPAEDWILNFNGVSSYMDYPQWAGYSENFELHFKIRNVVGTGTKQTLLGAGTGLFEVYALNSNIEITIPLNAGGPDTFTSSTFGQDGGDKQISIYRAGDSWRVVTDIDDETEAHADSASINLGTVGATSAPSLYLDGSVYDYYITDNSPIQDTNVVNGDGVSLYAGFSNIELNAGDRIEFDMIAPDAGSGHQALIGRSDSAATLVRVTQNNGSIYSRFSSSAGGGGTISYTTIPGVQYRVRYELETTDHLLYIDDIEIGSRQSNLPAIISCTHQFDGREFGATAIINLVITAGGTVYEYNLKGEDGTVIPATVDSVLTPASDGTWYNYSQVDDQEYIPANSRHYPIEDKGNDTQADALGSGSTDGTVHNVNHTTDWEEL